MSDLKLIVHKFIHRLLIRYAGPLRAFGDEECWHIYPDLSESSLVVSGGAGYDISFELELIEEFGCQVILMDPSLPGITAVNAIPRLPGQLRFLELGLAAQSGKKVLYAPEAEPDKRSWRMSGEGEGVEYDFLSIADILRKFDASKIDLLKIDIEGFEYEVLDQVLREMTDIRQLCVEFHQGVNYSNKTAWDRWRMILRLIRAGYRLIHVRNRDYTFLRV